MAMQYALYHAGVIYTVMDGPYRLPRQELLSCELMAFSAAVIL
jgi:hypothetical protein